MSNPEKLHFNTVLDLSDNRLWGAHFIVPDLVAQVFVGNKIRRVVCLLNGKIQYQCALLPKGDGSFLITVNKKTRDRLGLKAGSPLQVSLWKDDSEYGLPMPEELAELLSQDEEGNRIFHALTPGKIRTLLYIVDQVKDPDKRIGRALAIVEHLKTNEGKIDYKQLNEALRKSV
ncbi:MAG: YdeI/OmpD-associated family protein [Thermoanaerobaculia bacterium]|nr:YdeI/OmpD-associated family protein [Thermoanaerobaculia bacterium]